jgi:uncharacterized protein YeaO (DUF488 family)
VTDVPVGVIRIARVYDADDGRVAPRFLVDRVWPRGVRRADLRLTAWLPDVGPSSGLRTWFHHEPERWDAFQRRYWAELEEQPETWRVLRDAADAGDVTLLYGARDAEHNNAVALRAFLERSVHRSPAGGPTGRP